MIFHVFQPTDEFKSYRGEHQDGHCVAVALAYATGESHPTQDQVRLLHQGLSQLQQPNTVIEAYARADRVGSRRSNRHLSERRLSAIQYLLKIFGVPKEKLYSPLWQALGEDFEAFLRLRNGLENQGARSVWLFSWPSLTAYREGPTPSAEFALNILTDFGRQQAQRRSGNRL